MTRDRQARLDLTQAPGSKAIQVVLVGFFVVILATVTLGELIFETPRLPLESAQLERSFVEHGFAGLNRALLAALDRFEKDLNERSLVATTIAPWIQWTQTVVLGVGDHQVRLGNDGWLFFRPAVEFVTRAGFLDPSLLDRRRAEPESWQDPVAPDPRPAILAFQRELAERGIELVFLPVPTKAQVHPHRLAGRVPTSAAPMSNPSFSRLLEELGNAGVRVVDPTPALVAAAGVGDDPQFLARDTHWTPEAVEITASQVAEALVGVPFARATEPGWSRSEATASHTGDLAEMLGLPRDRQPWPAQSVTVHPVSEPDGRPWQPRTDAEVLLIGDSFSNVYSTADLGWGVGAGLAEQLSWTLERPVDRIAINAGGASGARRSLFSELTGGRDRLAGKRVVIWEVSARELSAGDWPVLSLSAVARPSGPSSRPGAANVLPTLPMGDGLVVWESNRTGSWRLFARSLEGGEPRQVSPDEPGKQHCCPHFSPDGTHLVYLSRGVGADEYPRVEAPGELRLLSTENWSERTLVRARSYGWGNRAVVWRDDTTLIFIDAQGRTAELDISTGETRLLVDRPRAELGWLLDPSLQFATSAAPTFSLYQSETGAVAERSELGGCEPYFSSDGRWGYWNAGPGGPIQRINPLTRNVTPLILRDDPRLPADWRYLYFVMTSRDDRVMAWGASNGDHDHFGADYEIFVAPTDPDTLQLVGEPRRITHHRATDRYPDVHLEPLAFGYQRVEAPHVARFGSPTSPSRRWQLDGRDIGVGSTIEHRFDRPGMYRISAKGDGEDPAKGFVLVELSHPPSIVKTQLRDAGKHLRVDFDEPVQAVDATIETDPPGLVADWRPIDRGRALDIELASVVTAGLRIRLHGISDLAQRPNALPEQWLEVAAPSWPVTERELLFAWENGRAPNLVFDPELQTDRASTLDTSGRTYPDRHHALVLDGGSARAGDRDSEQIARRLDSTLEVSLELLFTPTVDALTEPGGRSRRLLALSPRRGHALLELSQRGNLLEIELLTSDERPPRPIVLAPVESGRTHHLSLSFTAARLLVLLDGERLDLDRQPAGTLGPWRGKNPRLLLGSDADDKPWRGTIEALSIWGRALDAQVLGETWEGAQRRLSSRPEVPSKEVTATLVDRSPIPTLDEITPYRSGLVAFAWQPDTPDDAPITVIHWALVDGQRQPITEFAIGASATLRLEPLAEQRQLEPFFLSDRLPQRPDRRWFAVGVGRR
jgi:hypothetical protein